MNNFKKVVHDSVLRSDLLSTHACLRYGGQPAYQSFCPGIVSILTVSVFIAIFVIKILSVLQLQDISSFEHLSDNVQSAQPIQDIMFAMKLDGIGFDDFDKYFDFTLTQVTLSRDDSTSPKTRTQKIIVLRPCKIDYWQGMGISSMSTLFEKRGMSAFYCPTDPFEIQGTSDQDTYIYSEIKLKQCNQSLSPACLNATARTTYYTNYVNTNQYFTMKLYIKDTIISPTQQDPVSTFLQTDILLSFSTTTGTTGYLKIADYQIQTDTNIMPWNTYESQTGYFIERFQTTTVPTNDRFLYLKLEKSTKKLTVERQYGKIDDMLSYVGGLFGLIFYCIQFIMGSYNQYRYQLSIGQTMFEYDDKGDQVKQKDMHFFAYVQYSIYDWLAFFGWNPQCWKPMKRIHQTRQQANQQLDVRYLMKKIRYLQNVVEVLITQDQKLCLLLTQHPTLESIKKTRKVSQFYTKNRQAQTVIQKELVGRNMFGNFINSGPVADEYSKRVIPTNSDHDMPSFMKMQGPTKQQIELNDDKQSEDMDEQLVVEVSDAIARISGKANDPINQRILKKMPTQLVRKIKTRSRRRSIQSSDQQIYLQINKLNDRSNKK